MSAAEFYQRFTWKAVKSKHVRIGDLYANGSTVTEVSYDVDFDGNPARHKVLIRCGDSFATLRDKNSGTVVGRNFKPREVES